jgi:peptidoglycan/LPS O-acetylase OafA/YrhL
LFPKTINGIPKQISVHWMNPVSDSKGYYEPFEQQVVSTDQNGSFVLAASFTLAVRTIADISCYVLLILIMLLDNTAMKHYQHVFPWLPRPIDSELSTGVWYGILILLAIFSDKSFARLFDWNLARYAGKISFSLYLLHPFSHQLIFSTLFGPNGSEYVYVTRDNPDSNFFDLFLMSMSISWLIASISYHLVEQPSQRLCKWIIKNHIVSYYTPESKQG